jgi:hypothetical protein
MAQQKGMKLIEGYQEKPFKVIAHVQSMKSGYATLQPSNPYISYSAKDTLDIQVEKEYVFWVRLIDCAECRTKDVEILRADFTTFQIQKDQKTSADIIKQLNLKQ